MSPLRILIILVLLVMVVSGQDEAAPEFAPEAEEVDYYDEAESPTIESPSYAPISCPPSEAPSASPAFPPEEGPDSSDDEAEAPGLDDDYDATGPIPLQDYSDDDADETY